MLRVNGLYGWVSHNDRRSLLLFFCFIFAFHLLSLVGLFIPLAMIDPEHAPVYNWGGYAVRYIPLVTLWAAGLFAVLLWWHVNNVRKQSGFRYTYMTEEPRLCRIAEPLIIAAGLSEPKIAVIESPALNAFACGISKKNSVIAVTRGLLDGLDDDELGAVIAHELMHIKNGDVRLMAAANVCMSTLTHISKRRGKQANKVHEAAGIALSLVMFPMLFLVILVMLTIRQNAIKLGQLTRLLISSSREYMADAEAVRLTQNPAALVSALKKIDGRSQVENLPPEQDAMMIDGSTEGALATHPTISERVDALLKVTGSLALIPFARRDTRPSEARPVAGFGRRGLTDAANIPKNRSAVVHSSSSFTRVSGEEDRNMFGYTREMSVATLMGIAAFACLHRADIDNPAAMARYFDGRGFTNLMSMGGGAMRCQAQAYSALVGIGGNTRKCDDLDKTIGAASDDQTGLRNMSNGMTGGKFTTSSAYDTIALKKKELKCFEGDVSPGSIDRVYALGDGPASDVRLKQYLNNAESRAMDVFLSSPEGLEESIVKYIWARTYMMKLAYSFWGEAGYAAINQSYTSENHKRAMGILVKTMKDANFVNGLTVQQREDTAIMIANPVAAQPCIMALRIARGVRR